MTQQAQLAETLPVYILGFPFGADLAVGQGDPAITVCKGAVSAAPESRGELALVQITGDIHPGNSGGPVVDAAGRLVGIAVAKIRNTNIGFAIPTCQLAAVLSGRLASASVVHITDEKGVDNNWCTRPSLMIRTASSQPAMWLPVIPARAGRQLAGRVAVTAQLMDPLSQIRSVTIYQARGARSARPEPGPDGSWPRMRDDAATPLILKGQVARGTLDLDTARPKGDLYTFQCAYGTVDGRTVYTQTWAVHLTEKPRVPRRTLHEPRCTARPCPMLS